MIKDGLYQVAINAYKYVASNYYTPLPKAIEVETTKSCNLKCPNCRRNYSSGSIFTEPGEQHLTTGALWRILATTNASLVRFEGDGEPLMNPHFRELMKLLKRLGISSMMTSNGTLLTEEYVSFLEQNGMRRIHVSFDGASKDTYEKTKYGANYEKTLQNCKFVSQSNIQLFMNVVLFSDTIVEELPAYVEQAKSVRATGVHYMKMQQDSLDFGNPPDLSKHGNTIKEFNRLTKEAGLRITGTCSDIPSFTPCYDPFINPFVLLNDDVYACTYMANLRRTEVYHGRTFNVPYKNYKMGNVRDSWMKDIWYSNSYKVLRKRLRENKAEFRGKTANPDVIIKGKGIARGRFSFCDFCLCQWGESGL